ncbi:N-acetylneuraminate synthase family protein [Thalassospiraceae bacterium LMO-JJ14]|nr:N-acetylneuraminate synthase family protein [Thalassospiraceae bacterium LMO-JJ14]
MGTINLQKVFIIAEAGSNWRMGTAKRDMAAARTLIEAAAEAGADAVKFQTYRPETVYVANAGTSDYLSAAGINDDIRDIFADLAMPYEMIPELMEHAKRHGIKFMSSPFSVADFDAIDPYVEAHKIASFELSHLRLLERAGRSKKPLFLSCGASNERDIAWAVDTFLAAGGSDLILLQCTSKYPAPASSLNLRVIPWLQQRFNLPVGLSDHSREPATAPIAAVALGARVIEKHFTLNNKLPGPDHAFAITVPELHELVRQIRLTEQMLGTADKVILNDEAELASYARRGIQAIGPIAQGELLREGVNVDTLRPGKQRLGIHPKHLPRIEGKPTTRDIPAGDGIHYGDWIE